MKQFVLYWCPVIVFITVIIWSSSSLWRIDSNDTSNVVPATDNSESEEERSDLPVVSPVTEVDVSPNRSTLSRKELVERYPCDYYDPEKLNPENKDYQEYSQKVNRHNAIVDFIHSTRKEDEAFQRVMLILLENGYDIEDWNRTIEILSEIKSEYHDFREGFGENSVIEDGEVYTYPKPLRLKQEYSYAQFGLLMGEKVGIYEKKVVEELWDVDIANVTQSSGKLGGSLHITVFGDKLYTDEDWITPDFEHAMSTYTGETRPDQQTRIQMFHNLSNADTGKDHINWKELDEFEEGAWFN